MEEKKEGTTFTKENIQTNNSTEHNSFEEKSSLKQETRQETKQATRTVLPQMSKLNLWRITTVVLVVVLAFMLFSRGGISSMVTGGATFGASSSVDGVSEKVLGYINENLLGGQTTATLVSQEEKNGLVKVTVSVSGQQVDVYATEDGQLLFPQGIDMNEPVTPSTTTQPQEIVKSDKPTIELFVMSHCPYGTQTEKGILPVVDLLGEKIDFEIKFVQYAMHGKGEVDEEMRQVCMKQEDEKKFIKYLGCFLEKGDAGIAECTTQAGFVEEKLSSCVKKIDEQYGITAAFNDQSTWLSGRYPVFAVNADEAELYGVQGSPTLVINGAQVESGRSPAALLKTICSAFNTAPKECNTALTADTPSPGFGFGTNAGPTAAECAV